MIRISSDGLVRDGRRLTAASQVTLDLDPAALAPDVEQLTGLAAELDADPWAWVLHGGEGTRCSRPSPRARPGGIPTQSVGSWPPRCTPRAVLLDGAPVEGTGFDHFA